MSDGIAIFVGKLLASALVSALITMAGVYFVVDNSLRGIEVAIETTNKRIDDLKIETKELINTKFENLELKLKQEFDSTRKEIEKASLDIGNIEKIALGDGILIEWQKSGLSFDNTIGTSTKFSSWYVENKNIFASSALSNEPIFGIAPVNDVYSNLDTKHQFIKNAAFLKSINSQAEIFSHSVSQGCFEKKLVDDVFGKAQVIFTPSSKMIVGSNGMVCPLLSKPD